MVDDLLRERDDVAGPSAPDRCEECDNTEFTPCSRPTPPTAETDADYVLAYHECAECGERYNNRSEKLPDVTELRVPTWEELFGHPEPYSHQEEAIDDIVSTSLQRGYTVMEGTCGTGKTMIALTAGLRLVKDPRTSFERILVLTSVKQQQQQFEDDLRIINSNLPDDITPARAISLVGKTDLCPYAREQEGEITAESVTMRCRQLRDQTSQLMSDVHSGKSLAKSALIGEQSWETADTDVPYSPEIPAEEHEYCPFYANYKEEGDPLFTFGHTDDCVLDTESLVEQAVNKGVCPHSAMTVLCRDADVVIANYYHAFDSNTLQITHHLINDETLVVCDEAHMLEPRVRGILSTTAPVFSFRQAAHEVAAVVEAIGGEQLEENPRVPRPDSSTAIQQLRQGGVHPDVLPAFHTAITQLEEKIHSVIRTHLDNTYRGWENDSSLLPQTEEIPLRDPEENEPDTLTKWMNEQDIPIELWESFEQIGVAVADALSEGTQEAGNSYQVTDVAELITEWRERNHTRYFREITMTPKDSPHSAADGWQVHFQASVELHNVMPRAILSSRLQDFGAGVLMSATLEPMDVYTEVTGLDFMQSQMGSLVEKRRYGGLFPEENRFSAVLDLPKYTSSNRGPTDEMTEVREQYAKAILTVAQTTPGNVLVCMPSYTEAQWAGSLVEQHSAISKRVLVDESSTEKETQRLKTQFMDGDNNVLVTSIRGTLTEGVDFDGDKLLGCVVCGLPIDNVGSPRVQAVRTAYEDEFGRIGFDYGLRVPAVRKTRQALGRVIRGTDDIGVRVIVDGRYGDASGGGVRRYLSDKERDEYTVIEELSVFKRELRSFWQSKQSHSLVN